VLTKKQKEQIVADLSEKAAKAKSMVFVEFTGTNVSKINEVRRELKKNDAEMKVAKKTLINIALKNNDLSVDLEQFKTQMAVAFGYKDEISAAKVLDKMSKKAKTLKMLAGIVGKEYFDTAAISALAKLPSRVELLGKLVGTISAPISGFANVLQGNIRGLVQVLGQIKK
jgi:large subunit ribosomal protein L10